jgi:alpha-galactosidase
VTRIAIIGAGSVEFTRNIVADLCGFAEIHDSITLALHDIDEEVLPTRVARRSR